MPNKKIIKVESSEIEELKKEIKRLRRKVESLNTFSRNSASEYEARRAQDRRRMSSAGFRAVYGQF